MTEPTDALELLREIYADLVQGAIPNADDPWWQKASAALAGTTTHAQAGELERFAALVAAKEREACAQIADIHALGWQKSPGANPEAGFIASSNCATAIRARGKP